MQLVLNRKLHNLLLSIIMLALLASIMIFVFYPSNSKLGDKFGLAVALLFCRYIGLFIGAGLILLRLLSIVKNNSTLIYIFAGSLNISLVGLSLVLLVSNNMISPVFNAFFFNMLIGAIIFIDVMVFDSKQFRL